MSEPYPYVACLVADGDGMGAAIDALGAAWEHRAFSRELAKFAHAARKIVERRAHLGSLVYSGGDDVLAFLPVSTALKCADALREAFERIMEDALREPDGSFKGGLKRLPTLSVGIGIGHIMESMGDLLDLGRRAEKAAKSGHLKRERKDRNALAVIVDKRSGGTREWRQQWPKGPVQRLTEDQDLLTAKLPSRKIYQIADIAHRLPVPRRDSDSELAGFDRVLLEEVKRTLRRIDGGSAELTLKDVQLEIEDACDYATMRSIVLSWVDRLLIARAFAESKPEPKKAAGAGVAA
jgi:CRISPR-associated protein Cmr2